MILGTLAEFSYIPTTWNNTSYLARRSLYLVTLALLAGPAPDLARRGQPLDLSSPTSDGSDKHRNRASAKIRCRLSGLLHLATAHGRAGGAF
jgi:hypothetical protein